jgi:hypothetical protein
MNQNDNKFIVFFLLVFTFWVFYHIITPREEVSFKPLQLNIDKLNNKIDSLNLIVKNQYDSIMVLDNQKTYYINRYYYEKENIKNINSSDSLRMFIREQLYILSKHPGKDSSSNIFN